MITGLSFSLPHRERLSLPRTADVFNDSGISVDESGPDPLGVRLSTREFSRVRSQEGFAATARVDEFFDQAKVDALVESFEETGVWPNISGRPAKGGKMEIAYGHHRLAAMKKKGIKQIPIVIEDLTDEEIFKRIQLHNMRSHASNTKRLMSILTT